MWGARGLKWWVACWESALTKHNVLNFGLIVGWGVSSQELLRFLITSLYWRLIINSVCVSVLFCGFFLLIWAWDDDDAWWYWPLMYQQLCVLAWVSIIAYQQQSCSRSDNPTPNLETISLVLLVSNKNWFMSLNYNFKIPNDLSLDLSLAYRAP